MCQPLQQQNDNRQQPQRRIFIKLSFEQQDAQRGNYVILRRHIDVCKKQFNQRPFVFSFAKCDARGQHTNGLPQNHGERQVFIEPTDDSANIHQQHPSMLRRISFDVFKN